MGSPWVGRCLKSFLEVLRFVVTEYRAVRSHGDPIRDQNCGLGNIWETSGGIWGASGGIWEASGGIWEASGSLGAMPAHKSGATLEQNAKVP